MSVSKSQIIKLYKDMMREARKFPAYNFRSYALRRIKCGFNENKGIKDPEEIKAKYNFAVENYEILKRQVVVTSLYKTDHIVVENKQKTVN